MFLSILRFAFINQQDAILLRARSGQMTGLDVCQVYFAGFAYRNRDALLFGNRLINLPIPDNLVRFGPVLSLQRLVDSLALQPAVNVDRTSAVVLIPIA